MKITKDALADGKRLFRLCHDGENLNEDNLRRVIQVLVEKKPRGYRGILQTLRRLLILEIEQSHVVVETAQELSEASRREVEAKMIKDHGEGLQFDFTVNPELLGGMKIRKGDDVWDGSVKSRLARLAEQF